jgi:hypothetical protein
MTDITLSDELRRFIQSLESIPHLEALLLMRQGDEQIWNKDIIAKRLYLNADITSSMLEDLCSAGFCIPSSSGDGVMYEPVKELAELVNQLAMYYSRHLIEVTNIIHTKSKTHRRAHLFADAFLFKKGD